MADNTVTAVLTGCTASGKTALLLHLAEKLKIEVISADSRQVYRGMDVGTAKPSPDEQALLPHHLIDILDPDQQFSAGKFARMAVSAELEIRERGAVPVVAGGTVLYIKALCGGLDPMPPRNDVLRETLSDIEDSKPGTLHEALKRVDTDLAGRIGPRDVTRLLRALEIHLQTGKSPSYFRKGGNPDQGLSYRIAAIDVPDDELKGRIRTRASAMLVNGLLEEVRSLVCEGYGRDCAPGRTIGYIEAMDYLEGKLTTEEEVVDAIAANTWKLVRRQKNMFRRIEGIKWIKGDIDTLGEYLFGKGEY